MSNAPLFQGDHPNALFGLCSECADGIAQHVQHLCRGDQHELYCTGCNLNWTEPCSDWLYQQQIDTIFSDATSLIHERNLNVVFDKLSCYKEAFRGGPLDGQRCSQNWRFREYAYVNIDRQLHMYGRRTSGGDDEQGGALPQYMGVVSSAKQIRYDDNRDPDHISKPVQWDCFGREWIRDHLNIILEMIGASDFLSVLSIEILSPYPVTGSNIKRIVSQTFHPETAREHFEEFVLFARGLGNLRRR